MKTSPRFRGLVSLIALAALVLPSSAVANEPPSHGQYKGEGATFIVGDVLLPGETMVEAAHYKTTLFRATRIHDGSFETCTRVPQGGPYFDEYCMHGTFGAPGHASGTVKVYFGIYNRRQPDPPSTYHWKAVLGALY